MLTNINSESFIKDRFIFRLFCKGEKWLKTINFDIKKFISVKGEIDSHIIGVNSFSETYQDYFAYAVGRSAGLNTYLEIGAGHPILGNNTYMLEKIGWTGVSIELDNSLAKEFKACRRNEIHCVDALKVDYGVLLGALTDQREIAYLQIDIDPSIQSLETLRKIPFDEYRFAGITFEHDRYRSSKEIRESQRTLLRSHGYLLIAGNVKSNRFFSYEDWWVHPEIVDATAWKAFQTNFKHPKYMAWHCIGI